MPRLLSRRCAGTIRRSASSARCNSCQTRAEASRKRAPAKVGRAAPSSASRVSSSSLRRPESRSTSSTQLMSSDWLKPTRRAWSRGDSRALDAQEAGQVDDAVQVAAQVGDAEEPAVAVRHRHHRRHREDLARLAQREEKAARAALDGQPRLGERLGARGLQPLGQAALEIAQGLLVRHSRRAAGRRAQRLGQRCEGSFSRRRGSSPSARSGRPA